MRGESRPSRPLHLCGGGQARHVAEVQGAGRTRHVLGRQVRRGGAVRDGGDASRLGDGLFRRRVVLLRPRGGAEPAAPVSRAELRRRAQRRRARRALRAATRECRARVAVGLGEEPFRRAARVQRPQGAHGPARQL